MATNGAAAPPADFATALSNVRRLTSSSLPHQAKPAQLLTAIESAISSTLAGSSSATAETLPHTPTAYFASLLQCLEKAVAEDVGGADDALAETENMGQGALIPATLYLLAIVIPETPSSVVLSKLSALLECLLPLFSSAMEHPPALRSLLQVITSVLLLSPSNTLSSSPLLKRAFSFLLEQSLDPRPKVRHIAQEGVRKTLTAPVPPRLTPGAHPYLPKAREWVMHILEEETRNGGSAAAAGGKKKARFADADEGEGKRAIWVIQGLRGWVAVWGDEQLSTLCSQLLALPPLPHLAPQIYSLLAHLLTPPPIDASAPKPSVLTNLPTIIDSLLSSPPDLKDNHADITAYLSAITSALVKMSLQDPASLQAYLPRAFNLIFNTILIGSSPAPAVLSAAADAIGKQGLVRYCISDEMILAAVNYHRQGSDQPGARKKQKTPFLSKVISSLEEGFRTEPLKIPYLLSILTAMVSRLRLRVTESLNAEVDETGSERTAAEELLMDMISEIGDLRVDKGFEHKAKVDEMLGMALEVVGVEGVLRALPLNIEPDAFGKTPQPGRAHLLPLIRSHVTNDSLAYFASYFRPLSERVFGRKVAAEDANKGAEAKIWEIIVAQVWDCFPGFCEMARDMQEGLTPAFLGLLTNLLYTQPLLLSSLLRGLSQLVSSTQTLLNSTTEPVELRKQFGLDQEAAKENMAYLKTLAKDMVSVLLNVFSKLPREQRGMVGDVIGLWVGIMTEQDLVATYNTVTSHLSSNLTATTGATAGASPISHTMLDLLIIFTPQLAVAQSVALFTATASPTMLEHSDATVQKKSYRLLKRLIEAGKVGSATEGDKLESFIEQLNEVAAGVGPGAQRDRLQLLSTVVDILPKDRLHLIPELLSEAVLGTKEVNEKARDAGFDLLVVMGHKMAQGGTVKQQAVPAEEGDEEQEMQAEGEVDANVQEYITMVAAGLTGTTPHMISASINALSRLVFEFKDDISDEMISELVSTVTVFVASKNREIVKSALGFIKVAVVALPLDTVTPHLPALVPALLGWVHDHKNHFKTKTVHIFERMIRKFGYEEIIGNAPADGGERKVLEGIKRKKDRAKRKKAGKADEDGEADEKRKATTGSAFDDILYNSDTEDESDDEDGQPAAATAGTKNGRPVKPLGKKGKQQQQQAQQQAQQKSKAGAAFIRNDGDEPMDLLSRSIASGLTTSDPSAEKTRRKPGQDASRFKTDKTGKLIFAESDDEGANGGDDSRARDSGEGSAFYSAQRGVDGQSRDAKGNVRFNKNNKRSREMEREDEDAMDLDELIGDKKKKTNAGDKKKAKKAVPKLGEEFRAKRAGGDIKRDGGPDPYSYVPLGQASKRKGQSGRVALTNKKRGSRA